MFFQNVKLCRGRSLQERDCGLYISTLQDSHEGQRLGGEIYRDEGSSLLSAEKIEIIDIDDTHQS